MHQRVHSLRKKLRLPCLNPYSHAFVRRKSLCPSGATNERKMVTCQACDNFKYYRLLKTHNSPTSPQAERPTTVLVLTFQAWHNLKYNQLFQSIPRFIGTISFIWVAIKNYFLALWVSFFRRTLKHTFFDLWLSPCSIIGT